MDYDEYEALDENAQVAVRSILFDIMISAWVVDPDSLLPRELVAKHPALADVGAHIANYLRARGAEFSDPGAFQDGYKSFQHYTHEVRNSLPHHVFATLNGEMYRETEYLREEIRSLRETLVHERKLRIDADQHSPVPADPTD
jgi:hypothetical protein